MSDWIQLHSDVHISGGDGFSFQLIESPFPDWNLKHQNKQTREEQEFIKQCLPNNKPKIIAGIEVPLEPYNALRMYLCESMSATFALAQIQWNHRPYFIIGSRSQKDLFKILLKFPETTSVKVWDSNTQFYIRVAEGDSFSEDGSATIGSRRTFSNEGW